MSARTVTPLAHSVSVGSVAGANQVPMSHAVRTHAGERGREAGKEGRKGRGGMGKRHASARCGSQSACEDGNEWPLMSGSCRTQMGCMCVRQKALLSSLQGILFLPANWTADSLTINCSAAPASHFEAGMRGRKEGRKEEREQTSVASSSPVCLLVNWSGVREHTLSPHSPLASIRVVRSE